MSKSSDTRNERKRLFREAMLERGNRASRKVYAHKQVLEVALEMSHEVYAEIMQRDNELYAEWLKMCPDLTPTLAEELFVELLLPKMLEPARATLAKMLGMAQYKSLHEGIYNALIQDNILRQGRTAPTQRGRVIVHPEDSLTRH
jgi:hypothetical protein